MTERRAWKAKCSQCGKRDTATTSVSPGTRLWTATIRRLVDEVEAKEREGG